MYFMNFIMMLICITGIHQGLMDAVLMPTEKSEVIMVLVLMPLSTIFWLYRQFYCWKKPEYSKQTTDKFYRIKLYQVCLAISRI
jgi:hypothetical protein